MTYFQLPESDSPGNLTKTLTRVSFKYFTVQFISIDICLNKYIYMENRSFALVCAVFQYISKLKRNIILSNTKKGTKKNHFPSVPFQFLFSLCKIKTSFLAQPFFFYCFSLSQNLF